MSMNLLVDKLLEDGAAGMVAATTSIGQGVSVSYLPGSFVSTRNYLQSLSPIKKRWRLKVLEDNEKNNYKVSFEDVLHIFIPKKAYEEFNRKVLNVIGKNEVDLTGMINETRVQTAQGLYKDLNKVLTIDLKNNRNIKNTLIIGNYWLHLFRNSKFLPIIRCLIQLDKFDEDVRKVMIKCKNIYEDDVGNLEMLITAIEEGQSLNSYSPFKDNEYLMGVRIQSIINDTIMILEIVVDNSMVSSQSIYIDNEGILNELINYNSVKIVKNIIFPTHGIFKTSFLINLKEIVEKYEEEVKK